MVVKISFLSQKCHSIMRVSNAIKLRAPSFSDMHQNESVLPSNLRNICQLIEGRPDDLTGMTRTWACYLDLWGSCKTYPHE